MIWIFGAALLVAGLWMASQNTSSQVAIPFAVAGGVILIVALLHSASAHDASRPELNSWFDKLASGKGLCCSFADGTAVAGPDWDSKDGHYRVRLPEGWIDVPDDAVINEPNRDGRTMVWPLRGYLGVSVRCFMPGSMT